MKTYERGAAMRVYAGEVGGEDSMGAPVKVGAREFTKAVARYARRHGFGAATVRTNTDLRRAAFSEWVA